MARGQPDEATYTPQVQPEDLPRKVVPEMSGRSFGGAISQIGDTLEKKYQADSATWAANELAQFRVQQTKNLDDMKSSWQGDPNGFSDKYLQSFDKASAQFSDNDQLSGNPYASRMVKQGVMDMRNTLETHVNQWQAAQQVAFRTDSVDRNAKSQAAVVEAHPEMLSQVMSTTMDQVNSIGGDPSRRLALARNAESQLSLAAANGLTRQDPNGMLKALDNPQGADSTVKPVLDALSDQQREIIRAHASKTLSDNFANSVVGVYRNQGPQAGAQALAAVDKLDATPEIKEQAYANIERGLNQWHEEARQTHAQTIESLEQHLAAGKPEPQDRGAAFGLWRSGAWTAAQTGEYVGRMEKAQETKVKDQSYQFFINDAYKQGKALDPQDKDVQHGMAETFQAYTQNVAPGSDEYVNRAADMGAKTGITPSPAVEWARSTLVSGAPADAAKAAQAISRFQDSNPRGVGYSVDDKTKALAKNITDSVNAGTDPVMAVNNARTIGAMPDGQKLRLDELYSANHGAIKNGSLGSLTSQLKSDPSFKTGWFESNPSIPPSMVGQYEELRQNYFKLTNGNIDQANNLAFADLKHTWGVSQINGKKEYMEFSPEAMNPGLTTDFLRADMTESAKGHTDDPSKVRLIPTADTFHSNGQRWGLGVTDKFGAFDVVRDSKGNPIPYQLPTATQAVTSQAKDASDKGMAQLRSMQQASREAESAEWAAIEAEQKQQHHGLPMMGTK